MPRMKSTLAVLCLLLIVIRAAPAQQQPSQQPLGDDPSRFDERMEAATMRHDVGFFIDVLADDVLFSHGTGLLQNKQQWVDSIREDAGTNVVRKLDFVKVEPHGDLVETVGHVQVTVPGKPLREYNIWFVRLYARREGTWRLLSNRTVRQVNGPFPAHRSLLCGAIGLILGISIGFLLWRRTRAAVTAA